MFVRSMPILFILCIFTAQAWAKLELKNPESCYGHYGPAKGNDDIVPLDEYFVRYQIVGIKTDKEGKCDLEVSVLLKFDDGKEGRVILQPKASPLQRILSLGGDSLNSFGFFNIPEKAPLGKYTLVVTVKDNLSKESASFQKILTCKAANFEVIMPRFFRDADSKMSAGTKFFVGEMWYYKFRVVGFEKGKEKIAVHMMAEVIGDDGKPTGGPALVVKGDITDPKKVETTTQANFNGTLVLHRPGKFVLRITIEDKVGNKKSVSNIPFEVLAP